ncbi:unnamed protein product [Ilex paraguariensis]|uniref:Uncharacterized protein n=1 Tax=Ilex paraguariensis TaxID=185542 RepID=A0ABC8TAA5_9AQUA
MLKRQETLLSSSSRRETPQLDTHHDKAIGCMSGIFKLVSKYQHRRKFLTFGRKPEKHAVSSPSNAKSSSTEEQKNNEDKNRDIRRFSCDVPRSPTLPPDIRRLNSVNSPENFKPPPAILARLIGLDENPVRLPVVEPVAEKRRQLLGALEKCDEDLKALKKIIETVQSADQPFRNQPAMKRFNVESGARPVTVKTYMSRKDDEMKMRTVNRRHMECQSDQISSVSLLQDFNPSSLSSCSRVHTAGLSPPYP